MWYFEQQDHFGTWRPRTNTRRPDTDPRRNGQKKIRAVVQVPATLEHLSLDDLQGIYGQDVKEDAA
jgi:hypothetical protein